MDEFCSAVMTLGWSSEAAKQIFDEIDQDDSGLVSLEEFIYWFADRGNCTAAQTDAASSDTDSTASE